MTTNLKWRLGKLPSVDEVLKLVSDKIITQDEAKGILFNNETAEERDKESLKEEIKFLRELVEKISDKSKIIETTKIIEKPYTHYNWYAPYSGWINTTTAGSDLTHCSLIDNTGAGVNCAANYYSDTTGTSFTDIKTF